MMSKKKNCRVYSCIGRQSVYRVSCFFQLSRLEIFDTMSQDTSGISRNQDVSLHVSSTSVFRFSSNSRRSLSHR